MDNIVRGVTYYIIHVQIKLKFMLMFMLMFKSFPVVIPLFGYPVFTAFPRPHPREEVLTVENEIISFNGENRSVSDKMALVSA